MSLLQEFKAFAVKGNVIDMAVGIMIGGAFNKIVTSLVNDVIMPPIGKMMGGVDFKSLYINLSNTSYETLEEAIKASAPVVKYGLFIQTVVDFLIVALTIFVVIKAITKLKHKEEVAAETTPAAPAADIVLLTEIRDALLKK
jgi:large conductance mechanosensitive channel